MLPNLLLYIHVSMFTFPHEFLLYFIVLYLHSTEITVPLKNILRLFWGGCIFSVFLKKHFVTTKKGKKASIGNWILLVLS